MKRKQLNVQSLLVLVSILTSFCSVGFGAVYLRRSEICNTYWHAFIPADGDGEYYHQINFGPPSQTGENKPHFTIMSMVYGQLLEAKSIPFLKANGTMNTSDGELTFSVPWDVESVDFSRGGYILAKEKGIGTSKYALYDPPDDHDQIHLFVAYGLGWGIEKEHIIISWSDDSTTDLINTDYGQEEHAFHEIIVLSGAEVGARVLKIMAADGEWIVIAGIRSWDTGTYGDLSGDPDDCLLGRAKTYGDSGWMYLPETSDSSISPYSLCISNNTLPGKAFEWAAAWDSGGTDYDFSGGNNHMVPAATNNHYTLSSDYLVGGPEIWVDDTLSGRVWDDAGTDDTSSAESNVMTDSTASWAVDSLIGMTIFNTTDVTDGVITDNDANTVTVASGITWDSGDAYIIGWPRGTMLSGDKIIIRSNGTLEGATSGTAPDCEWIYQLDRTGLTVTVVVNWNSNINLLTTNMYSPMFPMAVEYYDTMSLRWPPDSATVIPSSGVSTTYYNKGSICEILCKNPKFLTRLSSFAPVDNWTFADDGGQMKIYGNVTGSLAGGANPVAGDVAVYSGKYEVRRMKSNRSEAWKQLETIGGWDNPWR